MEVGTHSPWISRLFAGQGVKILVANARKLRAIYQNERKCDRYDARMLAKIARLDPDLLCPIHHKSEEARRDLVDIMTRWSVDAQTLSVRSAAFSNQWATALRPVRLHTWPTIHAPFSRAGNRSNCLRALSLL